MPRFKCKSDGHKGLYYKDYKYNYDRPGEDGTKWVIN